MEVLHLDRLLVIPAAQQPLKPGHGSAAKHRLAMTRATFDGVPGVEVDPVEIDRAGLSYMVDTVEHLLRRWPDAELHLLIGSDVVPTLPRWHHVDRLLSMVRLIVMMRDTPESIAPETGDEESDVRVAVQHLATRRVDVSSTEIRLRVREGRSIRGFVSEDVAAYITSTGLYLEHPGGSAVVGEPAQD